MLYFSRVRLNHALSKSRNGMIFIFCILSWCDMVTPSDGKEMGKEIVYAPNKLQSAAEEVQLKLLLTLKSTFVPGAGALYL